MRFRRINLRSSNSAQGTQAPRIVQDYCTDLQKEAPSAEVYIGDPDYDIQTLHSSMSFRDAIVRLRKRDYDALEIAWETPDQHGIDPGGTMWTSMPGLALKYVVTIYENASRQRVIGTACAAIQFVT